MYMRMDRFLISPKNYGQAEALHVVDNIIGREEAEEDKNEENMKNPPSTGRWINLNIYLQQ